MTQEELDSMMNGDVDIESVDEEETSVADEGKVDGITHMTEAAESAHWPPPAPTDDNKMVSQLDDVTRESEIKASEIFDIIEQIGDDMMNAEARVRTGIEVVSKNMSMLAKLHTNFPTIKTFEECLADNSKLKEDLEAEVLTL